MTERPNKLIELMFKRADKHGRTLIGDGELYLYTWGSLRAAQLPYIEKGILARTNLSTAPYWLASAQETELKAIHSAKDLEQYLALTLEERPPERPVSVAPEAVPYSVMPDTYLRLEILKAVIAEGYMDCEMDDVLDMVRKLADGIQDK